MNSERIELEHEDLILFKEEEYDTSIYQRAQEIFQTYVDEGKIKGYFADDMWVGYSGTNIIYLDLQIDKRKYQEHVGKLFGISYETIKRMLKSFIVDCFGRMIFEGIKSIVLKNIINFLENYTEPCEDDQRIKIIENSHSLENFLMYIHTPEEQIVTIKENLDVSGLKGKTQRQLKPPINYMVLADSINTLYDDFISDEVFIKWFPIYFWVNITFVLPLRATETLVTHRNCIKRKNGKVFLTIYRTKLKKKGAYGTKHVCYDIDKDYKAYEYPVPDNLVIKNIEKYEKLTEDTQRKLLFLYPKKSVLKMLTLDSFNFLIESYFKEYIIGNHKYDFAKYATGIEEFEKVTAGDSRPIALASLYYQNIDIDICRQLAAHEHIDMTAHYVSNIDQIIMSSSVMMYQKRIRNKERQRIHQHQLNNLRKIDNTYSDSCQSPKRLLDPTNLEDCEENNCLQNCMGCRWYHPSAVELEEYLKEKRKNVLNKTKEMMAVIEKASMAQEKEISCEKLILEAETAITQYQRGCNEKVKELADQWQENKNTRKTIY